MVLKSLGRRGSFAVAKSLWYITKEEKTLKNPDGSRVVFTHNVFGKTLSEVEREYMENEMKRRNPKSNNIKVMHAILAFSPLDNENLNTAKLEDLTRNFYEKLNPNALFYATVHNDTDNFHVHIVISPTDIMGNSIRISKENFESLKISLQEYQKQTYPELEASVVEHGAEEKEFSKPTYWQKDGKISTKEILHEKLNSLYSLAQNRQEFLDLAKQDGLTIYTRNGKEVGITEEDRNYRFATLGYSLDELDKREEKLNELNEIVDEIQIPKEQEEEVNNEEELSEEEKRMRELDELSER
jgi:relaxase-like protein